MANAVFNRLDHNVVGLNRPAAGPGEYVVELPYEIRLSKPIFTFDGEKQKTNDAGQPIYLDEEQEVLEPRKAIDWKEETNTYRVVKEDGTTEVVTVTAPVPTEWTEFPPVMVPNEVVSYVTFQEAPSLFGFADVLAAKMESIKANNTRELVHFDEDFPLDNISDDLASHSANMGDGFIALHPQGQCRTVKLPLGKSADIVQIYLEAQPGVSVEVGATASEFVGVVDGIAQLAAPADAVYVRFINTVDRYREVYAFGILV